MKIIRSTLEHRVTFRTEDREIAETLAQILHDHGFERRLRAKPAARQWRVIETHGQWSFEWVEVEEVELLASITEMIRSLIDEGLSNGEIASRIGCTCNTVRGIRSRLAGERMAA